MQAILLLTVKGSLCIFGRKVLQHIAMGWGQAGRRRGTLVVGTCGRKQHGHTHHYQSLDQGKHRGYCGGSKCCKVSRGAGFVTRRANFPIRSTQCICSHFRNADSQSARLQSRTRGKHLWWLLAYDRVALVTGLFSYSPDQPIGTLCSAMVGRLGNAFMESSMFVCWFRTCKYKAYHELDQEASNRCWDERCK